MSVIYPGNYVARLNAYRDQGVVALPGVEFYRGVGAVVLNPDNDGIAPGGVLAAGDYAVQVLSPDMRQDDKPRLDKPLVVPTGAVVYRTAVSAPGVKAAAAADTIVVKTLGSNAPASGSLAAGADLFFPVDGVASVFKSIVDGTAVSTSDDTAVEVTTSANFTAEQNPSAGACRKAPSAIIVEVCYYLPAPAPSADDVNIPYGIEAGQGY
tara:strand:+ start:345 stop:974 length:630 start_codon:yes stop_codon:yes gene_type:complete